MHSHTLVISILITYEAFIRLVTGLPLLVQNSSLANPLVGFYIFPHGGITLDPENMDYSSQPAFGAKSKAKAVKLYLAMQKAAEDLIKSQPDLIIFSTPHGFRLNDRPLILSAQSTYGSAGGIWDKFTASFDIDMDLSNILYAELNGAEDPIEILSLGGGGEQMPLLWAEVIPWYFIREAATKSNFSIPKAIYIGQSPGVHIEQLRNTGRDIAKAALLRKEFSSRRIAVVISGDLSHYHSNDPKSPYPFNPISATFDSYIVNWAKLARNKETEKESSEELLEKAGKIQNEAGHCGYTGLVMLHGMLEESVNQNWNYTSNFYAYEVPTYFGMVVASWTPVT